MRESIETYRNTDGHYVHILPDPDPINPRKEFDHVGTIVAKHPRFDLSDEDPEFDADEVDVFVAWSNGDHLPALNAWNDDVRKDLEDFLDLVNQLDGGVVLPLYMFEHSGVALDTRPFGDPWDSGQVGYVYVTAEKLKAEGMDREQGIRCLQAEVEEFSNGVNGAVFGFITTDQETFEGCLHEEEFDSCWGFYGTDWQENGLYDHAGWPAEED
jgi:hypothetical protein